MAFTPTLLRYSPVVNVDLSDNQVNFADALTEGHRVQIKMNTTTLNSFFKWVRTVNSDRPVGQVQNLGNFTTALQYTFTQEFIDLDGIVGAQDIATASITNTNNKANTINDLIMAYVLQKVQGASNFNTDNKVFNTNDALNMVTNAVAADAIITSLSSHNARGQEIDQMFRDLLAADPTRFFDGSGIQITGLFETHTDVSGSGSWHLVDGDIIQIRLTFTFLEKVSRRVVSAQEQPTTAGNTTGGRSEEVTEETIIQPNDTFAIRLQILASDSTPAPAAAGPPPESSYTINSSGVITGVNALLPASYTIPSSINGITVTSIAPGAFQGNTSLQSVTLPPTITTIDASAFQSCAYLSSVTLPVGLVTIGSSAFQGTNLSAVTIPATVTTIGNNAFQGSQIVELIFAPLPGGMGVGTPDGATVGDYAFADCDKLVSITFESQITSIGNYAFTNCTSLANVIIPGNILYLSNYVFYNCWELKNVTLSEGVFRIGDYCFSQTGLLSVTLPQSLSDLGEGAFEDCFDLRTVTFTPGIGIKMIRDYTFSNVGLPELDLSGTSISIIGRNAFFGIAIEKLVLPPSIEFIRSQAFKQCGNLWDVTFLGNVNVLGQGVFLNCPIRTIRFQKINGPPGVEQEDGTVLWNQNGGYSFSLPFLTDIQSVYPIQFQAPTSNGLQDTLWSNYFNSIDEVGNGSISFFDYTPTEVTFQTSNNGTTITGQVGTISGSLVIPPGTIVIGDGAFTDASGLTAVTIPNSVTAIGVDAFAGTSLTEVTIPDSVTSLGSSAFQGVTSLAIVSLGTGLTIIEGSTFQNTGLITLDLSGTNVTTINQAAFRGVPLTSVILPPTLTTIGRYAFGYTNLTEIVIPASVMQIMNNAFQSLVALEKITFETTDRPPQLESSIDASFQYSDTCQAIVPQTGGTQDEEWYSFFSNTIGDVVTLTPSFQ